MQKQYLFIVALLFSFSLQAQIIDIPDANFKNVLVNTNCVDTDGNGSGDTDADTNDDGEISVAEAESVIRLLVDNASIISLEGINAFINLTDLSCSNNQLTSLDISSLIDLESLYCSSNQLTELNISNSTNLTALSCSNNLLTNLDCSDSSNLTLLDCSSNQLSNINFGNNSSFDIVYCFDNQLSSLDVSSSAYISEFDCSNNPTLTSLELGGSFDYLIINNTGLTEIDFSETFVHYLYVQNNANLTYVQLWYLDYYNYHSYSVTDNPMLEIISFKNGVTQFSGYDYDAGSYYICNNPSLIYVCADESEIYGYTFINDAMEEIYVEGVQDFVNNCGYTNVTVSSYCSFVPGGNYNTIEGNITIDLDINGCDLNDALLPNVNFSIVDGTETVNFISNSSGNYSIPVVNGSYTITPTLENPNYFSVSPSSLTVNFPSDTSPYVQDFCITANGSYNDLEVLVLPVEAARPGFDTNYKLFYKNKGTTTLSGSVGLTFQDDLMDFVAANPDPDSQASGSLSWNFSDLTPFEVREIPFTMGINAPTDTPPVNGDDVLVFEASVNHSETDETPDDNTTVFNQTVVNSYDPNDKTCLQGDYITPEEVGKYVDYLIRFENTGTASAVNIVVKDDIDVSKYDLSTLVPLHASHDYFARVKDQGNEHYIEFIFEDINLPFDDSNNDGYVAFKIKTLETLVLGDSFDNSAEIYFDYNFPIITEEATTTVAALSVDEFELADNGMVLYPNPTTNILNLESKQPIEHITIFDISGRVIQEIAVVGAKNNMTLSTENLKTGTYFVKLQTALGETVRKVMKD